MPIYETPYYGTRRKALTGQGYGPYYGMSLTGGGALPAEGGRALPAEISQKYEATGTPAITGGEVGEGAPQPAFTGVAFADDPNASWGQLAYHAGLPFGTAYPGHPQPTGLAKTALGVAPTVASKLTGLPTIAFNQVVRNLLTPLLSSAFPSMFTQSQLGGIPGFSFNPSTGEFEVDRGISPLSQSASFTGLNTSDIFGVFSEASLSTPSGQSAALAALGSSAALGSIEAASEGWAGGFGVGGFSGGSDTGFSGGGTGGAEGGGWGW